LERRAGVAMLARCDFWSRERERERLRKMQKSKQEYLINARSNRLKEDGKSELSRYLSIPE
jgi:hypothetical protein